MVSSRYPRECRKIEFLFVGAQKLLSNLDIVKAFACLLITMRTKIILLLAVTQTSIPWTLPPRTPRYIGRSQSINNIDYSIGLRANIIDNNNELDNIDEDDIEDEDETGPLLNLPIAAEKYTYSPRAKSVRFFAEKICKKTVDPPSFDSKNTTRTLLRYLSLPPEKYSLLDGANFTRVSDTEFLCEVDEINFLGNNILATISTEVDVKAYPEGRSLIVVKGCELSGGRLARYANGQFSIECVNEVSAPSPNVLQVNCSIDIRAKVPNEGAWIPKRLLGRVGSKIMSGVLKISLPAFLRSLKADYETWKEMDDVDRDY